jgi:hypothetical protein
VHNTWAVVTPLFVLSTSRVGMVDQFADVRRSLIYPLKVSIAAQANAPFFPYFSETLQTRTLADSIQREAIDSDQSPT